MAYTKHEWVTGEIITATNLNHMEDGIASKLDASAVVNSQEADTPGTALDAMQGNPDVPGSLAAQIKEAGESSKAIVLTQAQYDALTDEEKDSDNVYYISDAPFESSNVVPLTRAEYDALSDATKMDGRFYYITDEEEVAKSLVVQTNVNSTETVPSSAVVYGLKSDTDSQISDLNDSLTNLRKYATGTVTTGNTGNANIANLVPSGYFVTNVWCTSRSAFVTLMHNTNGIDWVKFTDWDGHSIVNTQVDVTLLCLRNP